jgi:hypothetical protein
MNTESALIGDGRCVLAFYGIAPPAEGMAKYLRFAAAWFTKLGYPPERLSVSCDGRHGKMGDYHRGIKKLEASGFSGVDGFSMNVLLPEDVSGALYLVSAVFSCEPRTGQFAILSVRSSCTANGGMLAIAQEAVEYLRPAYGIGFERPLREGPVWYALGVNVSQLDDKIPTGDAYEERRSISRWGNIGMRKEVYREGLLRYVYCWNFLTRPQLDRQVEGTSLADWIQGDSQRGRLSFFSKSVWLWNVDEVNLPSVRDRLHEGGAIFDWRKYCNVEPHIKTKLA